MAYSAPKPYGLGLEDDSFDGAEEGGRIINGLGQLTDGVRAQVQEGKGAIGGKKHVCYGHSRWDLADA